MTWVRVPYPHGAAVPTAYDSNWKTYTGLSKAQIAAFAAFPEDLTLYVAERRRALSSAIVNGTADPATHAAALAKIYTVEAATKAAIGKTVTHRDHIDTAFKNGG